jgi:asparagine synthase (glutamine-hydrolysing)
MCGIAGLMRFSSRAGSGANGSAGGGAENETRVDPTLVRQMCRAMVHRGPDDEGIYTDGPVGIGMRRLSIVDLATGNQPQSNEDGSVWIVFNGEIYNHAELREKLIARGHRYTTHSDTETIVHLYEEYGRDCVQHLRGMFAFAIWDKRKRVLFIARDRLGIKPLYYHKTAGAFYFGSEIKVILANANIRREFNRAGLPEFLAFGYLSGEDTFYSGIKKLMPGHTLELKENGELNISEYWNLPIHSDVEDKPQSYYVETYRDMLEQAVSSHLMSDVPLGVFLSGGIDSSAVAALMTKIRKSPVETFSVGYSEASYSELPFARQVAQHINSIHHEVILSRQDFFDCLPKLIWHEDEPVSWPSSVPLYFVAELARTRVKVVLTGEGSDETLGGYSRYAFTLKNTALDNVYRSVVPGFVRRQVREMLAGSKLIGATARRKLGHTFLALDRDSWSSFYFDNFFSAFSEKDQASLLTKETAAQFAPGSAYTNVLARWNESSGDVLQRLLYTDIKTYLIELLMKQDNMSMAASIESRVPFLDHQLVEFATNIPRKHQLNGLNGKIILKKAMEGMLPDSILYRPKLGFPTPWSGWLAGAQLDHIENLLLEPRSMDRGFFQRAAIQNLFREHREHYRDHYDRIWRLLNLELWHRVCIEGDPHNFEIHDHEATLASTV